MTNNKDSQEVSSHFALIPSGRIILNEGANLPSITSCPQVFLKKIPILVCSACAMARQINEFDLEIGTILKDMPAYRKAVAEGDRNLSL